MAVTISGVRKTLVIGPGYVDMFLAVAAADDETITARISNQRLEGIITPISATTGAGNMTITYSHQTPFPQGVLVTISQTAANERAAVQLWGY